MCVSNCQTAGKQTNPHCAPSSEGVYPGMLLERGRVYVAALSDAITLRPSHHRRKGRNTDEERLQRRKRVENKTKTGNMKKRRSHWKMCSS